MAKRAQLPGGARKAKTPERENTDALATKRTETLRNIQSQHHAEVAVREHGNGRGSDPAVDAKQLLSDAMAGACKIAAAIDILRHEHLKDTEVFAAAGAFLAAEFRKDATPPPPTDRSRESVQVDVPPYEDQPAEKGEAENGGEGG